MEIFKTIKNKLFSTKGFDVFSRGGLYANTISVDTLTFNQVHNFYQNCLPLSISIDKIVKTTQDIEILLKQGNEVIDVDNELYYYIDILHNKQLLNNTNSINELIAKILKNFLLYGEVFVELYIIQNTLQAIHIIEPFKITTKLTNGNYGFIETLEYNYHNQLRTYKRIGDVRIKSPYYLLENSFRSNNNEKNETLLFHICNDNVVNNRGTSNIVKIHKIIDIVLNFYQIQKNFIFNSTSLQGFINLKEESGAEITQSQVDNFTDSLKSNFNAHSHYNYSNANKIPYVVSAGIEAKYENINNEIPNIKNMLDEYSKEIYQFFNIPLQAISEKSSSYNNLTTAYKEFYNNVILSNHKFVCRELTNIFTQASKDFFNDFNENNLFFYTDIENLEFTKLSKAQIAEIYKKTEALTQDEIRETLGYPPLTDEQKYEIEKTKADVKFDTMFNVNDNAE